MTGTVFFTEEVSNSKVAAICPSVAVARLQATRVREALHLSERQVQVLVPGETQPRRKLEPESHGIYRTMLWSHARLGVFGALREGDSAVVVHALSAEQKRQAERILADAGSETTSTL